MKNPNLFGLVDTSGKKIIKKYANFLRFFNHWIFSINIYLNDLNSIMQNFKSVTQSLLYFYQKTHMVNFSHLNFPIEIGFSSVLLPKKKKKTFPIFFPLLKLVERLFCCCFSLTWDWKHRSLMKSVLVGLARRQSFDGHVIEGHVVGVMFFELSGSDFSPSAHKTIRLASDDFRK